MDRFKMHPVFYYRNVGRLLTVRYDEQEAPTGCGLCCFISLMAKSKKDDRWSSQPSHHRLFVVRAQRDSVVFAISFLVYKRRHATLLSIRYSSPSRDTYFLLARPHRERTQPKERSFRPLTKFISARTRRPSTTTEYGGKEDEEGRHEPRRPTAPSLLPVCAYRL